ncbi:helix-turn-helix transcriptional regulator [Micromonosporaceae bacterium B7E4]
MKEFVVGQPEFGNRLRNRRIEMGLSQKALAGDNMTPSYISLLENGSRVPSLEVVIRLARLLDITPQELLGYEVEGLGGGRGREPSELVAQVEMRRLAEMGDLTGARKLIEEKLAGARLTGNDEAGLAYGIELLKVLTDAGDQEERLALVDELRRIPSVDRSPAIQVVLAAHNASILREMGRLASAQKAAQEAVELVSKGELSGSSEHVQLLGILASIEVETNAFDAAERTIEEMIRLANDGGYAGVLGRTHWIASMAYSRMGRPVPAYEHLLAAHRTLVFGTMTLHDWLRFSRFTASVLLEGGHDLEKARDWIDSAELNARLAGLESDRLAAQRERAHYELTAGNPAEAARIYTELLDRPQQVNGSETVMALAGLSDALQRVGRIDEAIEWQRKAAERYEADGNYRRAAESWRKIDALRQQAAARG